MVLTLLMWNFILPLFLDALCYRGCQSTADKVENDFWLHLLGSNVSFLRYENWLWTLNKLSTGTSGSQMNKLYANLQSL